MSGGIIGATAIEGTTTPADNPPDALGPPGTYGASGRAAVPIEGAMAPIDLGDGQAHTADEAFAEAYAAANPPEPEPPAAATGATAGTPGTWTPPGCAAPDTLAACPSLGAAAAWTTGQHNLLADGTSQVSWDGAAWIDGAVPASGAA